MSICLLDFYHMSLFPSNGVKHSGMFSVVKHGEGGGKLTNDVVRRTESFEPFYSSVMKEKSADTYCNNCGKPGHIYNQCKIPITSFGIVAFRYVGKGSNTHNLEHQRCSDEEFGMFSVAEGGGKLTNDVVRRTESFEPEFLMIRRKDTLGYIDFMRGKYLVQNKNYIMNMLKQMTVKERALLREGDFDKLWKNLWGENTAVNKYKTEEISSKENTTSFFRAFLTKTYFLHYVP